MNIYTFSVLPDRIASKSADLLSGSAGLLIFICDSIWGGGGGGGVKFISGGGGGGTKNSSNKTT